MEEGTKKQINEYDNYLPLANIGRIIKNNLPKDVKLSKSSKETFQECVSEFISFITSEANDKCNIEKRKIIKGEDIIYALNNTAAYRQLRADVYRKSNRRAHVHQ